MKKWACSADLALREKFVQFSGETRCPTRTKGGGGGGGGRGEGEGDGRSCTLMCDQAFPIESRAMLVPRLKLGCSSASREMFVSAGNCSIPKSWCHWRFPSGKAQWSVSNHSSTAATISRIRRFHSQARNQSGEIIVCAGQIYSQRNVRL